MRFKNPALCFVIFMAIAALLSAYLNKRQSPTNIQLFVQHGPYNNSPLPINTKLVYIEPNIELYLLNGKIYAQDTTGTFIQAFEPIKDWQYKLWSNNQVYKLARQKTN